MPDQRPLRIAYLCDISPLNRNLYSGGNARIYDALCTHAGEVTILDTSWHLAEPLRRAIMASPEALNLRLRWRAHLVAAPLIARGIHAELRRGQFDVLFGAYSFQSLAGVTPPPGMVTVFTSDATPTVYKRSEVGQAFGSYLSAARYLDPLVLRAETRIYRKPDLLLWPSEWLRQEAQALYGLDPARAHVVPWGANVADPGINPNPPRLMAGAPVNLLFIGRDWFAKGGPLVHETLQTLRAQGVDARLTVIGTQPPEFHRDPAMDILGPLDKSVPDQLARFDSALRGAHFVMQPSFESYGFAYCEASAHGLPSLALRVGGVPVRDGVNGHALPLGSTAEDFAGKVQHYLANPTAYDALRLSARREYEDRLNWDAWGQRTATLLTEAVARKRAR